MTSAPASLLRAWHSPVGRVFVALHAALFVIAVANKGPADRAEVEALQQMFGGRGDWTYFAGHEFHLSYESYLMFAVMVADIPAVLASAILSVPVGWVLDPLHLWEPSIYVGSYLVAIVELLAASCQWLLVGSWVQAILNGGGQREQRLVEWVHEHQWALIGGIGGGAVVVIPLVYVRATLWLIELRAA